MKKFGKRLLLIVSVSTFMALTLVGCAKKTECDGCLDEKFCNEYVVSGFGQSEDMMLCNDCADQLEKKGSEAGVDIEKK